MGNRRETGLSFIFWNFLQMMVIASSYSVEMQCNRGRHI